MHAISLLPELQVARVLQYLVTFIYERFNIERIIALTFMLVIFATNLLLYRLFNVHAIRFHCCKIEEYLDRCELGRCYHR